MAKTYAELSREIEALKVQAEAVRQKEKAGVVERIRDAIAVYGLTAEELGLSRKATSTTAYKAPSISHALSVKYRDASGNTWGGRGPKPNWLKAEMAKGRSLEYFATEGPASAGQSAPEESSASPRAKLEAKKGPRAKKAFESVVKYRDDDGHTWSGRGPKPTWFTAAIEGGKTPEQLEV